MSKRDIIKIGKKSYYAVRDKLGRFTDITNIGKSIHEDARDQAKKTIKRGHGHEGDIKK
jgi:hypothetical protein